MKDCRVFWMITIFGIMACNTGIMLESKKQLPNSEWSYEDAFKVDFSIPDTSLSYKLLLNIEHTKDYPFENIYLKIQTEFPDETTVSDTISVNMADKFGNWFGKCGSTNCRLDIFLQENIRFKAPGKYHLEFEQFTRSQILEGIKSLQFTLQKSNPY